MMERLVIFLSLSCLTQITRCQLMCSLNFTNTITNGLKVNGTIIQNNVSYPNGTYFYHDWEIKGCICKVKNCIRKCCPNGQLLTTNGTCVIERNLPRIQLDVYDNEKFLRKLDIDNFFIIHGGGCRDKTMKNVKLYPKEDGNDLYYVQRNGQMHFPNDIQEKFLDADNYCLDLERTRGNKIETTAYRCFNDDTQEYSETVTKGNVVGKYFTILFFLLM